MIYIGTSTQDLLYQLVANYKFDLNVILKNTMYGTMAVTRNNSCIFLIIAD